MHSFRESGNDDKCPFCNSKCPFCNADRNKTREEKIGEVMKRAEANDPASIYMLGNHYHHGLGGLQQDHAKAMELYARAAELGFSKAHNNLAGIYRKGGYLKKAKFNFEAAAMLGNEAARLNIGCFEVKSGNMERAVKHWTIAASAGCYQSMQYLRLCFEGGAVSRESIDSTLAAYNSSCAEMRSEARDAYIRVIMENG
jgi:tetratricopeptide (TPR) repeat protein